MVGTITLRVSGCQKRQRKKNLNEAFIHVDVLTCVDAACNIVTRTNTKILVSLFLYYLTVAELSGKNVQLLETSTTCLIDWNCPQTRASVHISNCFLL